MNKKIWKPCNKRLLNGIMCCNKYVGIELLNSAGSRYYWIEGMNANHSGIRGNGWGGFVRNLKNYCVATADYVVDLETRTYAKVDDLGLEYYAR